MSWSGPVLTLLVGKITQYYRVSSPKEGKNGTLSLNKWKYRYKCNTQKHLKLTDTIKQWIKMAFLTVLDIKAYPKTCLFRFCHVFAQNE